MAIGVMTSEWETRQRLISRILVAWFVLGLVGAVAELLVWQPWGPILGVSNAPQRRVAGFIWSLLFPLPAMLWCMHAYAINQRWLAEDMGIRYEEGKRYPVFTPKRIVASALSIAFFGASGALTGGVFDFPQFALTFPAVLFGPIEVAFGGAVGVWIRAPLWHAVYDPLQLTYWGIGDGSYSAVGGYVFRKWILPKPMAWRLTYGLLIYMFIGTYGGWGWFIPGLTHGMSFWFWQNPWEAFLLGWPYRTFFYIPFSLWPNIILAYLAANAVRKYRT